jgi:phosphoglycolate phosphatase-like HAD superfamily hydrolase
MVGDTAADILAAQAARTLSGAALWGAHDRDALLTLDPTYAFEQPTDILHRISAQMGDHEAPYPPRHAPHA